MSTNRSRRIDRDAAEQLLRGAVGGPSAGQGDSLTGPDGPGPVARVLAAAAAPATAGELAGEEAALAAFRAARLASEPVVTTPVRRRSMATATLARAFSAKAAATVLGATALCGVAVAAGTGNLPALGGGEPAEPAHTLTGTDGTPGTTTSGSKPGSVTGNPSPGASAHQPGTPSAGPRAGGPSAVPNPGIPTADGRGGEVPAPLALLCRGFTDRTGKGENPDRMAAEPQYRALLEAAGAAGRIAEYCAGDDGRTGATGQPRDPGHGTTGPDHGNGQNNQNGGGNSGGANSGGGDSGGGEGGKQPGKNGVTAPAQPSAATPPVPHASRTEPQDDRSAPR
ncbi:hypothetical protein ACIBCA_10355 [Kitasatospora sp. NPDC051170]|uniref:hypothetical protein n=1 Tax=Kitasatospora sp. NPDC051170 TaxID=3364056 RepID=UPI0037A15157